MAWSAGKPTGVGLKSARKPSKRLRTEVVVCISSFRDAESVGI